MDEHLKAFEAGDADSLDKSPLLVKETLPIYLKVSETADDLIGNHLGLFSGCDGINGSGKPHGDIHVSCGECDPYSLSVPLSPSKSSLPSGTFLPLPFEI